VAHLPAGYAVLAHSFHLRASECASARSYGSAKPQCLADEGSPTRPTDTSPAAARQRSIMGTLMTLHFPNASRNYNPTQRCVCFWGHDSAFEVSFHLDEEALCKISPYVDRNEASLLHVFDVNRVRIQEAASVAYSRGRQNYHRLSASDLLEPVHRGRKHGQR
jgi:Protein of unknown function (DUF1488)